MISNIKAARWLGWTSVAVGLAELIATRRVQDELGVEGHENLIRAFGVREIAAGAVILSQPGLNATLAAALWGRVAGDALDLAVLGQASYSTRRPGRLMRITSVVLAIFGFDFLVAVGAQRNLRRTRTIAAAAHRRVRHVDAVPKRSETSNFDEGSVHIPSSDSIPSHTVG